MRHLYISLTDIQCGYLAGMIDGEGCINYYKSKSKSSKIGYTFVARLYITNTNLEGLIAIKNMVGFGRMRQKTSYNDNRKTAYELDFSPRETKVILEKVYPCLIIKKSQAKLMLEFLNSCKWGGKYTLSREVLDRRHDIFFLMKKLNQRGIQNKLGEFGETTTIPSQATKDIGLVEGVETNGVSSNNNPRHEHPTRKGRYSPNFQETERSQDKEPGDNIIGKIQGNI